MGIKKATILRTAVTFVALINSVLIITGKNPLPFGEDEIYYGISACITVASTLWSWWKNNSFTTPALLADEYLKEIKRGV